MQERLLQRQPHPNPLTLTLSIAHRNAQSDPVFRRILHSLSHCGIPQREGGLRPIGRGGPGKCGAGSRGRPRRAG